MVFDTAEICNRTTDWRPQLTTALLRTIPPSDRLMVDAYIKTFFDAHVIDHSQRVNVTLNCPDPWPPMLEPLWIATHDKAQAAMLLGNLYCRHAIKRSELWFCASLPFTKRVDGNDHVIGPSRHYFLRSGS
jgi:hypothetical protein